MATVDSPQQRRRYRGNLLHACARPAAAFFSNTRWTTTASGSAGPVGTAATLTWSIAPMARRSAGASKGRGLGIYVSPRPVSPVPPGRFPLIPSPSPADPPSGRLPQTSLGPPQATLVRPRRDNWYNWPTRLGGGPLGRSPIPPNQHPTSPKSTSHVADRLGAPRAKSRSVGPVFPEGYFS